MKPYYEDSKAGIMILNSDCLPALRGLADCFVDSVVTDPPAGISFMNKDWDHNKGGRDAWVSWLTEVMRECLRVLKPGGHALVWAIPRTSHWTGWAIESAGFEIRDRVSHLFGSGFPKSLDVSKAIDAASGAERQAIGLSTQHGGGSSVNLYNTNSGTLGNDVVPMLTAPATDAAKQWSGWGTALKPACEDWWLCRKPLSETTVAENVLKWGTSGLNIDGCRIEAPPGDYASGGMNDVRGTGWGHKDQSRTEQHALGRWPANVIHDGSEEVLALFPETTSGDSKADRTSNKFAGIYRDYAGRGPREFRGASSGSAARFFYCPKASKEDRGEWNRHPTVKPVKLMRYLVRLITPKGGTVLDPFCGSGSTGKACVIEGFRCVLIDSDAHSCELATIRLKRVRGIPFEAPKAPEKKHAPMPLFEAVA